MKENPYQKIPSISKILSSLDNSVTLHEKYLTALINEEIDKIREKINGGYVLESTDKILENIVCEVEKKTTHSLKNIINGTGIVLHTGFGRAPFTGKTFREIANRLDGYVNLEFNLVSGKRGDRQDHLRKQISSICNSESALVVNNNAAAVMLSINEIANKGEVIVSRGQLVEIGGSFRVPEIIEKSGAHLKEVGTTNRTHLKDYSSAITKKTKLLLWVHTSNYVVKGFTKSIPLSELVKLGKEHKIPVMVDWGSGSFLNMKSLGIADEIPVRDIMKNKPDLLTFSGDKLIGGPQSGIIIGSKKIIKQIQSNSFYRILRSDKITIAFLEEVLRSYKVNKFSNKNISLKMLSTKRSVLKKRGQEILSLVDNKNIQAMRINLVESYVEAGSGSLPEDKIESMALSFNPSHTDVEKLSFQLRSCKYPVVGYISKDIFYIDLKAVLKNQLKKIAISINSL